MQKKVLLAQLNSNGDCLYATVIARQIKEVDHPGCHLTWAVNTKCKQSVLLNPYVDAIWEVNTKNSLTTEKEWDAFTREAERKKQNGEFDVLYYTQVIGNNIVNFDGGIRSSMYNNYPHKITVRKEPIIRLSEEEIENVKKFAEEHNLSSFKHVILLECGPDSFKSSLNPSSAVKLAKSITEKNPDVAFILSSNKKINERTQQIVDASVLSFRENAELTKYSTFFVGCSSGISWLGTTDWAKPLQKIIVTNRSSNYTFSMYYDHLYAALPVDEIIEFQDSDDASNKIIECIKMILDGNFEMAKLKFHHPKKIAPHRYIYHLSRISFKRGNYTDPLIALKRDFKKSGFDLKKLLYVMKAYIKLPVYLIKNKKEK